MLVDHNPENAELVRYQIYSRREIGTVLRSIQKHKQQVMLSIRSGAHSAMTGVLQVDTEGNSIVIDLTCDKVLNQKVLEASPIRVEAILDRISILFDIERVEECLFDDRLAFVSPLPAVLTRLQRREYYRIKTPRVDAVHCTVDLHKNGRKTSVTLPLENISGGGLAIIDPNHDLNTTFGHIYDNCEIALPNHTFLVVRLEIRNCHDASSHNGKTGRMIGCQFIDLPRPMLSVMQRYITSLEREQCSKGVGLLQFL